MKSRQSDRGLYDADADASRQRDAFTGGQVPVAVYGLGKMGLPLAAVYADVTGDVVGVDVDESVASTVDAGECHVEGEPGLSDLVAETVERGALSATASPVAAAEGSRLHVVIVPTLITDDDEPDLAALEAAVESVGRGLSPGDLVVVESTVPPGTCRDVVRPTLCAESGLDPGSFGLAFCPERTASGRALRDIRGAHPKVVGGVDDESTRAAALAYGEITDNEILRTSDATTAEAVKVFEGIYRDVNIALANELARVTDDLSIDVTEAIDVANTQPYCDIHTPGPGVGGHCIPVYPYFLTSQVSRDLPLVRTARSVNDEMPRFVAATVLEGLAECDVDDPSVLLLGAAYRAGVAETRKAPARGVASRLTEFGADVDVTDPMLDADDVDGWPGEWTSLSAVDAAAYDAVVLVTAHDEFRELDWDRFDDAVVVDTRRESATGAAGEFRYTVGVGHE